MKDRIETYINEEGTTTAYAGDANSNATVLYMQGRPVARFCVGGEGQSMLYKRTQPVV